MHTYKNQKVVHTRKTLTGNYMQISHEDWMNAFQDLTRAAFGLYLYFAKNVDGHPDALSAVAVENSIGIKKSGYHKACGELEDKGYLVHRKGNHWDFYANPKIVHCSGQTEEVEEEVHDDGQDSPLACTEESTVVDEVVHCSGTEIDKYINKKINSFPASQRGSLAAAATQGDSFAAQTGEVKNEWEAEEAKEYIYRSKRDIEILSKDSLVDRLSEDSNNTKEEVTRQLKSWDVDLKQLEEYMQTNPYIDKADYWGNLKREYNDWHDRAVFVTDGWLADILSVYEAS